MQWDAGLGLEWYKNTYSNISSMGLGGKGEDVLVFMGNQVQSQVRIISREIFVP